MGGPLIAGRWVPLGAGARGLLAAEEEQLFKLRQQYEQEAREELDKARLAYEEEVNSSASADGWWSIAVV